MYIIKPNKLAAGYLAPGFLKLLLSGKSVCVFVYVCVHPEAICSVMWSDMNPYDWLNKFYSLYIAAVIGIIDRCSLRIKTCSINQSSAVAITYYTHFNKQA